MKKIYLLAAVTLTLAACNSEDSYNDEPVAARVSATIGGATVSRAVDNQWHENDAIGITMGENRYVNIRHVTQNGDGLFEGTPMYFRNNKIAESFSAYYPFSGTEGVSAGLIEAVTTSENQTPEKQREFDFLHAVTENVIGGTKPEVDFQFAHKMSKLTFIFTGGSGVDVSNIVSYNIEGLTLEGTFDSENGTCVAKDEVASSALTISPTSVSEGAELPSLIVFPQTRKDVKLGITDSDGQSYVCSLAEDADGLKLESGFSYIYTVTVSKTGLSIKQSNIVDWTTKTSSFDATFE